MYYLFVIAIFRYHLYRLLHSLLQCSNDKKFDLY
jgi:hypothetical protein